MCLSIAVEKPDLESSEDVNLSRHFWSRLSLTKNMEMILTEIKKDIYPARNEVIKRLNSIISCLELLGVQFEISNTSGVTYSPVRNTLESTQIRNMGKSNTNI
ncbi:hypothetical protein GL2_39100 [Microbulbifer sp. GL-2]|nr:hypothetical protein GL2_39100 [Microbulbifer sp. GL-2]